MEIGIGLSGLALVLFIILKFNSLLNKLTNGVEKGVGSSLDMMNDKVDEFSLQVSLDQAKRMKRMAKKIDKLDSYYTSKDIKKLMRTKRNTTATTDQ